MYLFLIEPNVEQANKPTLFVCHDIIIKVKLVMFFP